MNKIIEQVKFIHLLTFFSCASVFAFDVLLAFHDIPKENKSIVDFIAGVLNTACLAVIIAYWYGSTSSSKERNKQMMDLVSTVKDSQNNTDKK